MPYLISIYTNKRSKIIGYVLFALRDLTLIKERAFDNKSSLHSALEKSFGKIGTRQALHSNIESLGSASLYEQEQIEIQRSAIKDQLKACN